MTKKHPTRKRMNICDCRYKIEKRKLDEDSVFKICKCSKGCSYCASNNLYRTDWSY